MFRINASVASIAILLFVAFNTMAQGVDLFNNPRHEAEYLAIEITANLEPQVDLANQIESDLAAIRTAYPSLADIRVFPDWAPGEVRLNLTRETYYAIEDGTYTGFDDLFDILGTPIIDLGIDHPQLTPGAHLEFDKVYHGVRLAELFADAPGVVDAFANGTIGDGNDIIARVDRTYTLSRGFGDCPAGCIHRISWDFTVTNDGVFPRTISTPEPAATVHFAWLLAVFRWRRRR